jgi:hypothetical protein
MTSSLDTAEGTPMPSHPVYNAFDPSISDTAPGPPVSQTAGLSEMGGIYGRSKHLDEPGNPVLSENINRTPNATSPDTLDGVSLGNALRSPYRSGDADNALLNLPPPIPFDLKVENLWVGVPKGKTPS